MGWRSGASAFTAPPRRLQGLALAAICLAVAPAMTLGQTTVGGRVSIVERGGGRTRDLANTVIYLEPVSGAMGSAPPVTVPIAMESREFVPRIRVVSVGSVVEFPNHDPFRHNVFSKSGPNDFDLGLYGRGETRGATLRTSGVFPIFCNIHARMVAFAVAVPTPYFTQAAADGSFAIADVPAGRYTLHLWHDRAGTHVEDIEVGATLPAITVQLDARGYKFVQHRNKFGQEYTSAGRDRY